MTSPYNAAAIEAKWQQHWAEQGLYATDEDARPPKFYVLSIFPYPSGHLNLGHIRYYTLTDAIARVQRMRGYRVLYPAGWDAFGLPAENAACEQGIHPAQWTQQNIDQMRHQLKRWGLSCDWSREITTCSPDYYRWTQWIFLAFFKAGLAYRKETLMNWDPVEQTTLMNEQVDANGCAYRSGAKIERRVVGQWYFKITAYAEQLWQDLHQLSGWPRQVRLMQKHWIGKSMQGGQSRYRLQDWLISRDRYWGAPIPMIHCANCGLVPVPEAQLPVTLPETVAFADRNPVSLETVEDWAVVDCPTCGQSARRDTNTLDTFADSSWYSLRCADARNQQHAFETARVNHWMAVDQYVVGMDQAYLHLLYARFFTKALHDLGLVAVEEPFRHLLSPGVVTAPTYKNPLTRGYVPASQVHPETPGGDFLNLLDELRQSSQSSSARAAMSFSVRHPEGNQYATLTPADFDPRAIALSHPKHPKSGEPFQIFRDPETGTLLQVSFEKISPAKRNNIDLEAVLSQYGADVARLVLLAKAPPEADLAWQDADLEDQVRFLNQVWRVVSEFSHQLSPSPPTAISARVAGLEAALHQSIQTAIRRVTAAIGVDEHSRLRSAISQDCRFDAAISALMTLTNTLDQANCKHSGVYQAGIETLIKLMAPFAPHITEELWHWLGHPDSVHSQPWPIDNQQAGKAHLSPATFRAWASKSQVLAQAIAQNPHAPSDLLRELAQSDNFFMRRSAAANPALPVDVLLPLSEDNTRPPDNPYRDSYWQDRDLETIQQVATRNPNLPLERLVLLAARHPFDAVQNPAAPAFLLAQLAEHWHCKSYVARHPHTAAETILQLAADSDGQVRSAVAARFHLPLELFTRLAHDPEIWVREQVAKNPTTPGTVIQSLAQHPDSLTRILVARRSPLASSLIQQLAADPSWPVRNAVALRDDLWMEILIQLARDPETAVRQRIASKAETPVRIVSRLAEDLQPAVRTAVATRTDLPMELFMQLAHDPQLAVREQIAKNAATSASILSALIQNSQPPVRLAVASRSDLPMDLFMQLSEDAEMAVREGIAENPATPARVLDALTQDSERSVRAKAKRSLRAKPPPKQST